MHCQSIFQYSIIKKALIKPTLQGFWVKQCGIKVTQKMTLLKNQAND